VGGRKKYEMKILGASLGMIKYTTVRQPGNDDMRGLAHSSIFLMISNYCTYYLVKTVVLLLVLLIVQYIDFDYRVV
jgi:hypothetical protein